MITEKTQMQKDLDKIKEQLKRSISEQEKAIRQIEIFNCQYKLDDMLVELKKRGCSYNQIADITGLSFSSIYSRMKSLGLVNKRGD